MTNVSKHAKQRLRERNGLNKKSTDRIAERAFNEGITHAETTGNLNKWITSLYFKNTDANNIRLYGDKAYIFANTTLVTIIPIPRDLMPIVTKIAKRKKASTRKDG